LGALLFLDSWHLPDQSGLGIEMAHWGKQAATRSKAVCGVNRMDVPCIRVVPVGDPGSNQSVLWELVRHRNTVPSGGEGRLWRLADRTFPNARAVGTIREILFGWTLSEVRGSFIAAGSTRI
jgi:hypothetical protein